MLDWIQNVHQQMDAAQFLKFKSVNSLSISGLLKQLSKVRVKCRSEEYFFGKLSTKYHQSICGGVYF